MKPQKIIEAFKQKDIRKRILFTLLILIIVRLGSQIPLPCVNGDFIKQWMETNFGTGSNMGFFDAITGGSFENMSIFALNITPYITSSIIMQLLSIAIPKFEEWHKDGEDGRKKITKITRILTVILSLGESAALVIGFGRSGYLTEFNAVNVITAIAVLTAGSTILMWLGERVTEKGVGNGISIVLTINIISRIPKDIHALWEQFVTGKNIQNMILSGAIIIAIIIIVVVMVVILQGAERRIPVQYSRKVSGGRQQVGRNGSHIPLKINTAGVIPIIFAQSIMMFPVVITQLLGKTPSGPVGFILSMLSQSNWCDRARPALTAGLAVYILLIIAFAYFYTTITFNPLEVANNMKRSGGFIPGIRPGKPTSDYLSNMLKSIILIGAIGLSIVAIIPIFFEGFFNASISFGGTSLIIIVGVVIETLKQIDSQIMIRSYHHFLKS